MVGGVVCSIIMSPFLAGLAVSIGVPILLCYVYGVVPIALCRSEGTYLQFTNHLKLNRFSKITYFMGEIFDIKITAQQKVCFAEIFDDM